MQDDPVAASENTTPPEWPNDPLSQFFAQADYNCRVAAINYPSVFRLLQRQDELFRAVQDAFVHDSDPATLIPRLFFIRVRSVLLAAIRSALSGQIPETQPLYRSAIEYSWYALHIAKDPVPPTRAKIWLNRGDDETATRACKVEFTIGKVRASHAAYDSTEAAHLHEVYEGTIDMGAHPNQLGLFSAFASEDNEKQIRYDVGILYPEPFPLLATVGFGAGLAISILRLFRLIYPERFAILGIDQSMDIHLKSVQQVFASLTTK